VTFRETLAHHFMHGEQSMRKSGWQILFNVGMPRDDLVIQSDTTCQWSFDAIEHRANASVANRH
jgi:hypothetical protein